MLTILARDVAKRGVRGVLADAVKGVRVGKPTKPKESLGVVDTAK